MRNKKLFNDGLFQKKKKKCLKLTLVWHLRQSDITIFSATKKPKHFVQ